MCPSNIFLKCFMQSLSMVREQPLLVYPEVGSAVMQLEEESYLNYFNLRGSLRWCFIPFHWSQWEYSHCWIPGLAFGPLSIYPYKINGLLKCILRGRWLTQAHLRRAHFTSSQNCRWWAVQQKIIKNLRTELRRKEGTRHANKDSDAEYIFSASRFYQE